MFCCIPKPQRIQGRLDDILRPIRDGLRDNLPERAPVEDHERTRQQQLDTLKGFAYFYTFDELDKWTADKVLPLQKANTPLLRRAPLDDNLSSSKKAKLTLIHDYAGNYHDYEQYMGADTEESELGVKNYVLNWHSYVENFVYFSHKLVCIPPPAWTNSLHRHGVKSFGTFLVEPGSVMIDRILARNWSTSRNGVKWVYPLATQLTEMAKVYGFDGWLINIEKTFPVRSWNRDLLIGFLEQLKAGVGDGNVLWYDALDSRNRVHYHNGLTEENLAFAKAAGSLLTNYAWTLEHTRKAEAIASMNGLPRERVIFGIDVWAQNTSGASPKRETWPIDGGGGTGTGRAVAALAHLGFSAGVFAPAWAVEHEYKAEEGPCALERAMWAGEALHAKEGCSCEPGTHEPSWYQDLPIVHSAPESAAGSSDFFYSNFVTLEENVKKNGWNSILPSRLLTGRPDDCLHMSLTKDGLTVTVNEENVARLDQPIGPHALRLFNFNATDFQSCELIIKYRQALKADATSFQFHYENSMSTEELESTTCFQVGEEGEITLTHQNPSAKAGLTGLSLVVDGALPPNGSKLIDIISICIRKRNPTKSHTRIDKIWIEPTGLDSDPRLLLSWSLNIKDTRNASDRARGLPESPTTGSIAYFYVNNDRSRRIYSTQDLLQGDVLAKRGEEIKFRISGWGFAGEHITAKTVTLRIPLESQDGSANDRTRRTYGVHQPEQSPLAQFPPPPVFGGFLRSVLRRPRESSDDERSNHVTEHSETSPLLPEMKEAKQSESSSEPTYWKISDESCKTSRWEKLDGSRGSTKSWTAKCDLTKR
ncbi:hypothetical protein MBLNU457_1986t1 [Dothideomycetes sp. NU457]